MSWQVALIVVCLSYSALVALLMTLPGRRRRTRHSPPPWDNDYRDFTGKWKAQERRERQS